MDDIDMEFKQRVLEHLRIRAEEVGKIMKIAQSVLERIWVLPDLGWLDIWISLEHLCSPMDCLDRQAKKSGGQPQTDRGNAILKACGGSSGLETWNFVVPVGRRCVRS